MKARQLPEKFTDSERRAYKWLHDCQLRGWMVDLITKEVHTESTTHASLDEFAEAHGMQPCRTSSAH